MLIPGRANNSDGGRFAAAVAASTRSGVTLHRRERNLRVQIPLRATPGATGRALPFSPASVDYEIVSGTASI